MAAKSTPTATAETAEVKGTTWLAEHVNSETGKEYDGYSIRILLRSLIKDGTIERGEGRYNFSGPRDKTVLAVVKAVKSGSADKAKAARLDELKAKREAKKADAEGETDEAPAKPARSRAAKKAAEPAAKPARTRKARAAKPVVEEEADEDLDIDEI